MEKFIDLLNNNWGALSPLQQLDLTRRFYSLLVDRGFNHWIYGDPIPLVGQYVLLGITNYSRDDMMLLDALSDKLDETSHLRDRIGVFCALEYLTVEDREKCLPGLSRFGNPRVGIWQDGELINQAVDTEARRLIIDLFGLNTLFP
ncbi:MAG TPA: hypothetical protein VFC63_02015 [Blastocatellia bacterium]|nr:hypothetical protein [Blastocatellia bacterium]